MAKILETDTAMTEFPFALACAMDDYLAHASPLDPFYVETIDINGIKEIRVSQPRPPLSSDGEGDYNSPYWEM